MQTLVMCADVLGCSSVRQYQTDGGGAGGGAEYRLVTLRLLSSDMDCCGGDPATAASTPLAAAAGLGCCIAYLILFDDQVRIDLIYVMN